MKVIAAETIETKHGPAAGNRTLSVIETGLPYSPFVVCYGCRFDQNGLTWDQGDYCRSLDAAIAVYNAKLRRHHGRRVIFPEGSLCPQCRSRLNTKGYYYTCCNHCGWIEGMAIDPLPEAPNA